VSQVSAQFSSTERQVDQEFSQTVEQRLFVSSRVLLKGVVYSPPREIAGGGFEVDALLTEAALADTVEYLRDVVSRPLDAMDEDGLKDVAEHAVFLQALLTTSAGASLRDRKLLRKIAAAAREQVDRRLNQGVVVFDGAADGVRITVDGTELPAQPEHFLPPGEHGFLAEKPGCLFLHGTFNLSAGERKVVRLSFITRRDKPALVTVSYAPGAELLKDEFEEALARVGVRAVDPQTAGNALRIGVQDVFTEIDKHRKHRLLVFASAYRAETLVVKVKAAANYYSQAGVEDYLFKTKAAELVQKLVPTLVGKLDRDGFFSDLAFDYRRFFDRRDGQLEQMTGEEEVK